MNHQDVSGADYVEEIYDDNIKNDDIKNNDIENDIKQQDDQKDLKNDDQNIEILQVNDNNNISSNSIEQESIADHRNHGKLEFRADCRAYRFDQSSGKYKSRGEGVISISIHRKKARIEYFDCLKCRLRMLQFIDGNNRAKIVKTNQYGKVISKDEKAVHEVEWIGTDYSGNVEHPLTCRWKVIFANKNVSKAEEFKGIFNDYINANDSDS